MSSPSARVTAFKIVYAILVLNFFIPAVSYIAAPELTHGTLDQLNRALGGAAYPAETGHLWHMLGVGNVMTLAFLCGMLWLDLRRYYPALPALLFLKGFSATYALFIGLSHGLPVFYAVFVLDGVTTAAMYFFASRAYRALTASVGP